jgi:benzoyl-CoA reductase/2-hydroxyglutaryl-CoA dehydratase subunit BcrC/BadD/HgdB
MDKILKTLKITRMEEAIRDLKRCVKQYREVDDKLRALNREVFDKREARKIVEMELADLMKVEGFAEFRKLKIEEDGSTITIQRPQEWSKPWSLSKKDLKDLLERYFNSTNSPSADKAFEFITEAQKNKLTSTDFNFSRVVPEED